MTTLIGIAAFASGLAAAVAAPSSPKDITRLQVARYKTSVALSCQDQGRQRKEPWDAIRRKCKCLAEGLEKRLNEEDWKRATFYAATGKGKEEAELMARHADVIKACAK